MLIGTADYIAPEQTQDSSAVDQRVDLYSLGYTLYYFLTGRGPFDDGTVAQKFLWHQLKSPTPVTALRSDVPAGLGAVLDRMMAKDREQRYATAAEVEAALVPWFDPRVPPPPEREMPRVRADEYRVGLVDESPDFATTPAGAAGPAQQPPVGQRGGHRRSARTPTGLDVHRPAGTFGPPSAVTRRHDPCAHSPSVTVIAPHRAS